MSDIKEILDRVVAFRDARDWKQFHNPKDCALSLALEAAEVMECFQWKSQDDIEDFLKTNEGKEKVADELADVLYWVLLMSNDLEIDIKKAFERKIQKTEEKYPIEHAKGRYTKYTEL